MRAILIVAGLWIMLASTPALAEQLLVNRGFETGDLSWWTQEHGVGVVVTNSNEMLPPTPYAGSYFHSSSGADGGNRQGGNEITIAQAVDVSGFSFIGSGNGRISAGGYFSGATGSTSSSDDTGQIIVQCFDNGTGGTLLLTVSTTPIDPPIGRWSYVAIPATNVPTQTDTIVFRVRTVLDPGFSSIDVGADSFTLFLTSAVELSDMHLVDPRLDPGGVFSFDFTNTPSAAFRALATEDLAVDVQSWEVIGPALETAPGQYEVTDPGAAGHAKRYYAVESE